jgi:hypothetical protein
VEGNRDCVTLGSELEESLGEALCMIPLGVTVGNVAISRWLGAKLSIMEGDRVTLGSELKESLGETLCIPLGVKLGNETLACWLGVKLGAKLGIVEGDREVVTLRDEL